MTSKWGYWGARPDIVSAIARIRVWDKTVPARDIPCLCVRLTAIGALSLALNFQLDIQCSPVRWRFYGELVPLLLGSNGATLFRVEPGFFYVG